MHFTGTLDCFVLFHSTRGRGVQVCDSATLKSVKFQASYAMLCCGLLNIVLLLGNIVNTVTLFAWKEAIAVKGKMKTIWG